MLDVISPIEGAILRRLPMATAPEVAAAVEAARAAQAGWRLDYAPRARAVTRFRELIERDLEDLASTLTLETGKPITQARNEIRAFIGRVDYFLEAVPRCLRPQRVHRDVGVLEEISFDPLGVVGCISAWNYPYFVGGNVFIPALLTGNAVLYKPSEVATLTGMAIGERLVAAGVPPSVFSVMVGEARVGQSLAESSVDGLFFTGSLTTGQTLARSLAGRMVPLQLELGGKDAVYVCEDVPIERTAGAIADGGFYNAGQSCCSVERIYVHSSIYSQFLEHLLSTVRGFSIGDPRSAETYIGPLARAQQIQVLERQVHELVARGGHVLLGGARMPRPGNYFAPTVIVDAPHDSNVVQQESFGPIVVVAPVADDAAAVERMNDTRYGLTAGVYTSSRERARAILGALEVGTCYWNACDRVSPRLPWSGRRDSGIGVTLSTLGMQAFLRPRAWHWVEAA